MPSKYESNKRWREKNREFYNDYMRDYRSVTITDIREMMNDPDEIWFERDSRKRRNLIRATPSWVDRESIRRIYNNMIVISDRYHTEFVVHHVVPISHSKVCGLHIPENLKIISKNVKATFGRKFDAKSEEQEQLKILGVIPTECQ